MTLAENTIFYLWIMEVHKVCNSAVMSSAKLSCHAPSQPGFDIVAC